MLIYYQFRCILSMQNVRFLGRFYSPKFVQFHNTPFAQTTLPGFFQNYTARVSGIRQSPRAGKKRETPGDTGHRQHKAAGCGGESAAPGRDAAVPEGRQVRQNVPGSFPRCRTAAVSCKARGSFSLRPLFVDTAFDTSYNAVKNLYQLAAEQGEQPASPRAERRSCP